jgi:hypothetical protein
MRNILPVLILALALPVRAASWSGWHLVEGGGITDAPVAAVTSGSKISLFARGVQDGRIYVNTYQ